jgi:hypothetical protein
MSFTDRVELDKFTIEIIWVVYTSNNLFYWSGVMKILFKI